jgi:hypothetical protein
MMSLVMVTLSFQMVQRARLPLVPQILFDKAMAALQPARIAAVSTG